MQHSAQNLTQCVTTGQDKLMNSLPVMQMRDDAASVFDMNVKFNYLDIIVR